MRKQAREIGIAEEDIDRVLAMPDEELQFLEMLQSTAAVLGGLMRRGPNKRVGYEELNNGVAISTVVTADLGPETAIITVDGRALPVERYASEEYAEVGHREWVERMKAEPKTIQPLGMFSGMEMDEVRMIYRDEAN